MNEIKIIHELCAEDRARIDRLTLALENNVHDCVSCAQTAIKMMQETPKLIITKLEEGDPGYTTHEEPAEAPETPTAEAAPIDHPASEDMPWDPIVSFAQHGETTAPAEKPQPTITQDQLQQKVMQLAAANGGALKAKVREIVNTYAKKVSDIPEGARTEVWHKLTELEKGAQ